MTRRFGLAAMLLWGACDGTASVSGEDLAPDVSVGDTAGPAPDAEPGSEDVTADAGVEPDLVAPDSDGAEVAEPPTWDEVKVTVGIAATSLSMGEQRVAWEDAGAIWVYDLAGGARVALAAGPSAHVGPVLANGDAEIVFSDDRNGNFDLFTLDIATLVVTPLVVAEGDQVAPTADGDIVAWVDKRAGDQPTLAEIWAWDRATGTPRALTADLAEQSLPFVRGRRVVFTDFGADPDKQFLEGEDPNDDNGDIAAFDLPEGAGALGERIAVSEDPDKQSHAAIDGDRVVWLDWRGISPEPKYKAFKVYGRALGQPEVMLGESSWSRPALWQRPAIDGESIAWVVETSAPRVMVGTLAGTAVEVPASFGELDAIGLRNGALAFLGGGRLGIQPLDAGL